MNLARQKRLLIAAPGEALPRVPATFEGRYSYFIATSLAEAQAKLTDDIDLIACGLDFDEGRMFDLLRYAKSNPATKSIPFLCLKTTEGKLSPAIFQSVEIAVNALGAAGFVELYEWRTKLGNEAAYEKLRQLINRLLNI